MSGLTHLAQRVFLQPGAQAFCVETLHIRGLAVFLKGHHGLGVIAEFVYEQIGMSGDNQLAAFGCLAQKPG